MMSISTRRDVQVAVLDGEVSGVGQASALAALAQRCALRNSQRAPSVGVLPSTALVSGLPATTQPFQAVLGIDDARLAPALIDLADASFLVCGPARSGRSQTLATIAHGLAHGDRPPRLFLICARRSPLSDLDVWTAQAHGEDEAYSAVQRLLESIERGSTPTQGVVLIIDDMTDFVGTSVDVALQALWRHTRDHQIRFVASIDSSGSKFFSGSVLAEMKKSKSAMLLQPDIESDGDLVGIRLPRRAKAVFPPGRGYLVQRGAAELVQVALTQ
jgi:DNA segregation ATPase FtsK/SpoIIIE, S-DNA-T family